MRVRWEPPTKTVGGDGSDGSSGCKRTSLESLFLRPPNLINLRSSRSKTPLPVWIQPVCAASSVQLGSIPPGSFFSYLPVHHAVHSPTVRQREGGPVS